VKREDAMSAKSNYDEVGMDKGSMSSLIPLNTQLETPSSMRKASV
jgi:hypothetical protein